MNSLTTLAHDWKNRNYEDFHSPFFPETQHGHDYIRIRVFLSGKLDKIWISKIKRNILFQIFDKFGHALKNSSPDLDTFVVLGQIVLLVFLMF
jgi:6-pyruvoyl-tetrahydropterin synthase